MRQASYRDQDYAFGQLMLTLRTAMGLTQSGLAEKLSISRRSVADWEAGGKYPSAKNLQVFIALAVQHRAFPVGREAAEIRALWQASRQKVLLDEQWLTALLTAASAATASAAIVMPAVPAKLHSRTDWGEAQAISNFYGREAEMNQLRSWIVEERCRVISVLGPGGIGKSTLTIHLMYQLAAQFDAVIWRSLRDVPTCDTLLISLLQVLAPHALEDAAAPLEQRLNALIEQMRSQRVLLVLDNLESVLTQGAVEGDIELDAGKMLPNFHGFDRFLRQSATSDHQSCVLLTSREKLTNLLLHEGINEPVRAMRLGQLDEEACGQLLAEKGLAGSPRERQQLIEAYAGNPLALKIAAQTIVDLFDKELAPFLEQGGVIFEGVRELLHEQYSRLSPLEQSIVFWLAIMREPLTLNALHRLFILPQPPNRVIEIVNRLHRRSLIERGHAAGTFTLQSVVIEYVTDQLITELSREIQNGQFDLLMRHGLEQAQVKDHVRRTQTRLLVTPLLASLQSMSHGHAEIDRQLCAQLDKLRAVPSGTQGYAPANLAALLREIRGNLRGVDLSALALRGANLQGVEMQNARMVGATIQDCDFTETFDGIANFAISRDGRFWAASSETGEARLWKAGGHLLYRLWRSATEIIYRVALSPDGTIFVGGTWDGVVKAWDIASGNLLWAARWHGIVNTLFGLSFSPDGSLLAVTGDDGSLRLLNARTGVQQQMLPDFQGIIHNAWSPDGRVLAIGDDSGKIRFWLLKKDEPAALVYELSAHHKPISDLEFSPDGSMLVSVCAGETVKLWATSDLRLLHLLEGHPYPIDFARWSPDGRTLACNSADRLILLWDVERAYFRAALQGHKARIGSVLFTPDGRQLISNSRDGTLRVWDANSYESIRVLHGYFAALITVAWSPDGQQLVAGGSDALLTMFKLHSGANATGEIPFTLRLLHGAIGFIFNIIWSPDGRWLASTEIGDEGTTSVIRLWDVQSGECVEVLTYPEDENNVFYGIAWSPDGQRLALGTRQYGVMICDMSSKRRQFYRAREYPTLIGSKVLWSPDGRRIAAEGSDRLIYLWDADGNLVQQLAGHQDNITDLSWSADSQQLLSVSISELLLWDIHSGEARQIVVDQTAQSIIFNAVMWGDSERTAITGSTDGKLRWWDLLTGDCLLVHEAHQAPVQMLRKSPDGTVLACCGNDGAVTLWDLQSRDYLQTLRRDRPYEHLDITGIKGLTDAQMVTLRTLGAVEVGDSEFNLR
ncbi:MAG: PD40 domain-containing protein [Anaerolineae bacterium]|nr:PD40 domain-containing protein [Anaerolineae bacterium]